MAPRLAGAAGGGAMVERDGTRYTLEATTSVGDVVRSAARHSPHHRPAGTVHTDASCLQVVMTRTSPASPSPDAAPCDPVTPTVPGAVSPRSLAPVPAPLAPLTDLAVGVWWKGREGTGNGGDRKPVLGVVAMMEQHPPPAGASGRRRRQHAPLAAELGGTSRGLGDAVFVCSWAAPAPT